MSSAEASEDLEFNPFYQALQVSRVAMTCVCEPVWCAGS